MSHYIYKLKRLYVSKKSYQVYRCLPTYHPTTHPPPHHHFFLAAYKIPVVRSEHVWTFLNSTQSQECKSGNMISLRQCTLRHIQTGLSIYFNLNSSLKKKICWNSISECDSVVSSYEIYAAICKRHFMTMFSIFAFLQIR